MLRPPLLTVVAAVLVLSAACSVLAADSSGRDIMEQQQARHALAHEMSTLVLVLVDQQGASTTRVLRRWSKDMGNGLYRTLMVFQEPRDIAGTALLSWQLDQGQSKQWLHLPGKEGLSRIASEGRKSYFMGTDFTYEDLQHDALDPYHYTITGSEVVDGEPCHLIEITPASKEKERESGYSKRLIWIRKDILYPVKIEFYDRRGNCIKTQTNHELAPLKGDTWICKKAIMINHKNGHKTLMGLKEHNIEDPIDDSLFTEDFILSGKHRQ